MLLKIVVVLLFIGNIIALGRAFVTLMRDQTEDSTRTAHWLKIRVTLAILLIATVTYGIWSGDLGISSPWYNPQS